MIRKKIMSDDFDKLHMLEICIQNDYIGYTKGIEYISYLGTYEMIVEFENEDELIKFYEMYDIKGSNIGDKDYTMMYFEEDKVSA